MIEIRVATPEDAGAVSEIYAPWVALTPVSFEIDVPGAVDMAARINDTVPRYPWLVCERDSYVVGYAYASEHRTRAAYQWSVDTAVYIREGCRGRGVGKGLYVSLIRILTAQRLHNAYAGITLPNAASVALHESVGFRPVGVYERVGYKLGAWHDVGWWALELQPRTDAPQPPLSLPAVSADSGFGAMLAAGAPLITL
jgi:phosphinothricin acetyltransferase